MTVRLSATVGLLACLLAACGHPAVGGATEASRTARAGALHPVNLVDQDGRAFGPTELQNHVWITALMFTACTMACPVMAERLRYVQTLLPSHSSAIKLLSITVDPETDTPPVLLSYASRFHRDPAHWTFVTGETDALFAVVNDTYKRSDAGRFDHGETLVLLDGRGAIQGYYRKDDAALKRLLDDADALAAAETPPTGN